MRKFLITLLFAFIFATSVICGFGFGGNNYAKANSGPPHYSSHGGLSGISFVENDSIKVLRENLLFEIEKGEPYIFGYEYKATRVTAEYKMKNISDTAQSIKMAFPYFDSISYSDIYNIIKKNLIEVKDGENSLPYSIRILGAPQKSDGTEYTQDELNNLLKTVEEPKQKAYDVSKNYSMVKFTGSTVRFSSEPYEGFFYAVNAVADVSVGTNYNIRLVAKENDKDMFIIVESTFASTLTLPEGEVASVDAIEDIDALLLELIKQKYTEADELNYLENNQPELLFDIRDFTFIYNEDVAVYDENNTFRRANCILGIFYEASFAQGETKYLTVSYYMSPYRKSEKSSYSDHFVYFLSPASYWGGFEGIHIVVDVSSSKKPYMIEESLDFTYREADKQYIYGANSLPEGELYFVLYESEKLPVIGTYDIPKVLFIAAIIVIIIIVLIIIAVRSNSY